MKIIADNFIQNGEARITASSANTNYPVTNLSHQFRSKTWRSSGNFTVTSSNNKINFKDGGAEKTATITSGSYNSTTLSAEIKTQLELLSADTFTVSFNNGIWNIASNGTSFELLNATGTNAANSLLKLSLGYADSDRTGALSYSSPKIAIHTEEFIKVDLYTTDAIDSVVLLWPKENGLKLSSGAQVYIQANPTDNWTSPAVSQLLTVDNIYSTYSHYFSAAQNYRYWRVVIIDPTNAYLYVDLGLLILGKAESIEVADKGFTFTTEDTSIVTRTAYGNEYVDEYPTINTLEIGLSTIDYSDATMLEEMYKLNGTRKPVYVALDQTASVFSKNHFSIYGKMQSNFQIGQVNYDIFDTKLTIREIL